MEHIETKAADILEENNKKNNKTLRKSENSHQNNLLQAELHPNSIMSNISNPLKLDEHPRNKVADNSGSIVPVHRETSNIQDVTASSKILPPRAENLIHQAKEKLIAQCVERGINTTHPDDIDNAATKLASLAYADKMTHIEKVLFNDDCTKLYALSHEPHMKLVSVNAKAVMVPAQESIAQMQQTAQLFAEQAQQKEQQMVQNQNQNKGPKLG